MPAVVGNNVIWFIVYFLISASIGIFIRDIPGQPELFATIENFTLPSPLGKGSDPYSFASGALEIYRNGWVQPESQWLVKLWPPGFMVTEGLILKIFGINAPFIFILILLISAFVALMLSALRRNLLLYLPITIASILPLFPFLFPVTRFFLLQPVGIVLGEGFSIVFFLTSMFLVPIAARSRSLKYTMLSGLMLALAAYFRSQFELFVSFLTLTFMLMALAYFFFFRSRISGLDRQHMASVVRVMVVVLIVAHAAMLPWRLHNLYEPATGNMSWVQTQSLVFANAGKTDRELVEAGAEWIMKGRGNAACVVEPRYCGAADSSAFYKAFIYNPIDWFLYKCDVVGSYWIASLKDFGSVTAPAAVSDLIANSAILFLVFANLALLVRIRRHPDFPVYVWQCLSFYACSFVIFLLVHFETRYFYALKIYGMFTFVPLLAIAWHVSRSKRAALSSERATWFRYA